MPQYRRLYVPGGTFFFTLVTYGRVKLFADEQNVARLRRAFSEVKKESPFDVVGAVVVPDHGHFMWVLPESDSDYSRRIGRLKVLFTRSLKARETDVVGDAHPTLSQSRLKHRESDVWQRRFWEHMIRDEDDFRRRLDYIHYNPVKHGLATCPHKWPYSSFDLWVRQEAYRADWCCSCDGRKPTPPDFQDIAGTVGE